MDYSSCVGRCLLLFFSALLLDAVGLVLFLIGVLASLSFWDLLVFSGALVIFFSLVFWILWYLGNLEVPMEDAKEVSLVGKKPDNYQKRWSASFTMEKVLENVVAMVKEHPAGIPLKKLAVFYSQTYRKNLTLTSLGFDSMSSLLVSLDKDLVVEEQLVRHKAHCHPKQAGAGASTKATEDHRNIEEVLEDIVAMVKQHSAGIPLKKLSVTYSRTYNKHLTLSSLGFDSMASLVAALDRDLVVQGELVFCNYDHRGSRAGAGPPAKVTEDKFENVLKNVVALMTEFPDGIPLKTVAIVYSQKYRHNLALASLGFRTISCLVASLKGDLVVRGDIVFHKIHQPQNQLLAGKPLKATEENRPATPQRTEPLLGKSSATPSAPVPQVDVPPTASLCSSHCLPVNPLFPASKPAEKLTQHQLYQRVIEVINKYQLSAPSMDQLQTCYSQQFDEQLPMSQYMSLYDSCEASSPKKLHTHSEPTADPKTAVLQKKAEAQHLTRKPEEEDLQQSIVSNLLSSSDFPVLGTDVSSTKEKKKTIKDASKREGGATIFRDAFHAQLREVHGANMRAVEASEKDDQELKGRKRNRVPDQDSVNSLMEDVIRDISAEGELVTKEKVISRVSTLMQIPSLEVMIRHWTIPALKDLQYVMREINMFIESSAAVASICTLYELGQSLAGLKDKKRYEELNLGPLCKLPLIHRMFKIDSNTKDDDIHQIETIDILKQIRVFRRQQNKPKVDLAEFMKYLADHYNCDSPYELGVRIQSIALPISTILKVSRCEHSILEHAMELIQKELEEETYERLRKIKKIVLEPVQGAGSFSSTGNLDLRRKYVSMPAAEVSLAVFSNAERVFSPKMAKHVQNFLLQVSGNRLAKALFQLAICGGSLAVPLDLVPKDNSSNTTEQTKREEKPTTSLASEAKVKQYLKDSLSSQSTAVTLAHLASLERKLTKHFLVKDFISLEQGNFLEFLLSHIESALRAHYRIRDSRDLGYGSLQMLAGLVQRQRGLSGGGLSQIHYESALFAKHSKLSAEDGGEAVGRLGEMSKAQALASLLSCPLLEDLKISSKEMQAKTKQVLITVAQSDRRHMNCLHRLGILLGITDWVKDYQKKLNTHTAPVEQAKELSSHLIDSESNSLSALNMSEDEYLEDNIMDNTFASSNLNQSIQQGQQDVVVEEGEDEEELYELSALPNGETSDISSEAEGGQDEEQSELSDSATCQSTADLQRAIIEDIRKSEFGIGVELNAAGLKLMQVHQDRLGRSLDRLSTELYSKDTHFVLELIQVKPLIFTPIKMSLNIYVSIAIGGCDSVGRAYYPLTTKLVGRTSAQIVFMKVSLSKELTRSYTLIQFSLFCIAQNYKFASEGFKLCTHSTSLIFDLTSDQEKLQDGQKNS
ncbi:Transmembrane protein 238 [Liparis tanakae]|uniref:Transmembrane protein 238 n=1 Tax=Liparis tanakae TaxID=230148 RepID=A0A4Z2IV57_9TELE|nr:Transmembrane protein 238 [Liparis tanakae]